MRLLMLFLLCFLSLSFSALSAPLPTDAQLKAELKKLENSKHTPNQAESVEALQNALNWLVELKTSQARIEQYQKVINDFPKLTQDLRNQLAVEDAKILPSGDNLPIADLEQQILQTSSQLLEQTRLLQQEQDQSREISDSLNQLPKLQTDARRALSEVQRRLQAQPSAPGNPYMQAQLYLLQTEAAAQKAKVNELELAQLSANNRQELARMRADIYKKRHEKLDIQLQALRNNLNNQRQREAELALEKTEQLAEQSGNLPKSVAEQLQISRNLSTELNAQAQRLDTIASQQREATEHTLQARQTLTTIIEQAQWLGASSVLGETLRVQLAKLPEMPKPRQADYDMAQIRVQRLQLESQLENLPQRVKALTQDNGEPLTRDQQHIVDSQLRTQQDLLNSLLAGCDTMILELTKLKVANTQLLDALNDIKDATHRYLFWVPDINPITLSYPLDVAHSLTRLVSLDTLTQLSGAFVMMVTSKEILVPIFIALLLVIVSINSRKHYQAFLDRSSAKIGKVTQDQFSLTLRTVLWSLLIAVPLPVLWAALGYGLQNAWPYPVAVAIGDGVTATLPILWVCMICAAFAHPKGLFIAHFNWPKQQVTRAMRYYKMSIWLIVPLIMALITFDNLNDREFASTLGCLCFILLCLALVLVTGNLKRAGLSLYVDKSGSGDNIVNNTLWGLWLSAPLVAAISAAVGYLNTAQALLARLEISVGIWFFLLLIYHIIRRWMLIQRRRIEFDRAKQRRAEILAHRARSGEEPVQQHNSNEGAVEIEVTEIDLDEISAQSLRLVRSILTMIALVSVIILWSGIHSAFGFLENITLWETVSTSNGIESNQPITLGSVFIAVLVLLITMQLVRNFPALLELAVLQHLDLAPGTGYAITTITKYLLLLFGIILSCAWIGVEWSKLQWVVTALSVGLGFGMQEIFSNFISGLIILFEKPIRIGDTVTIRNLTGTITKINTRATTIADWDRKEIIVPNKAFITEQFVNWSLSDSVTRIVLTVPAPAEADTSEVVRILIKAAKDCALVLSNPAPDAYLVSLQQGIQIFELRIYAAEMSHRMPLRHEVHQSILAGYHEHNIMLPYPPFQVRADILNRNDILTFSASAVREPGAL